MSSSLDKTLYSVRKNSGKYGCKINAFILQIFYFKTFLLFNFVIKVAFSKATYVGMAE